MKLRYGLLLSLAGCTSSPAPAAPSGSDASSDSSAAPDSSAALTEASTSDAAIPEDGASDDTGTDAGPPCNTLANDAPAVPVLQISADPPVPQGGTIVDGTYWETSLQIFTGPNGPAGQTGTSQTTGLIQGQTVQLVSDGQPTRRTVILTATSDGGFTSVDTCPDSQTAQGSYTATPTTLTIFLAGGTDDAGLRTVVETLTKQ